MTDPKPEPLRGLVYFDFASRRVVSVSEPFPERDHVGIVHAARWWNRNGPKGVVCMPWEELRPGGG